MVCFRCEMTVKAELEKLGIEYLSLGAGEIETFYDLTPDQRAKLEVVIKKSGLELLFDKKKIIVEKIKNIIIDLVHYSEIEITENLSEYMSKKLGYSYAYLANLFTESLGLSIEQFYIRHRIVAAKEFLSSDEFNLTEIAGKLHFSCVAHLGNQFKKDNDMTFSPFMQLRYKSEKSVESA